MFFWDSKLIDHEGLSEADIAKTDNVATPAQIKKWQADSPMEWIWEATRSAANYTPAVKLANIN